MSLRTRRRRPGGQLGSAHRVVPGRRLALAVALLLRAAQGPAVLCHAAVGLVIEPPNVVAAPGSSGSFDVLLVNTDPAGGASFDVAADSLGLSLAGPLSLTFTAVSIKTVAAPYIYVKSGTTVAGGCRCRWTPSRTRSSRPPTPSSPRRASGS